MSLVISRHKIPVFLLYACALAVFGPYVLSTPIRSEQAVVYLSVLGALCSVRQVGFRVSRRALTLLIPWLVLLGIAVARTLVGLANSQAVVPPPDADTALVPAEFVSVSNLIAGIDSFILPCAVCWLVSVAVRESTSAQIRDALSKIGNLVLICLTLNTALAVACLVAPDTASSVLAPFWPSGASVATASIADERFTGIFNQPGESGAAYSIGLLLLADRIGSNRGASWWNGMLVIALLIGGALSASKIFLGVGIPIAFVYLLFQRDRRAVGRTAAWVGTWTALTGALAAMFLRQIAFGFEQVNVLVEGVQSIGLLGTVTGGRIGGRDRGSSVLTFYLDAIMERGPVFGLGFGSLSAYDSAYIQMLAFSGLIGLLCYCYLLAALGIYFWIQIPREPMPICLMLLILVVGFGMPTFTMNRGGTLMVLVLACHWWIAKRRREEAVAARTSPSTD